MESNPHLALETPVSARELFVQHPICPYLRSVPKPRICRHLRNLFPLLGTVSCPRSALAPGICQRVRNLSRFPVSALQQRPVLTYWYPPAHRTAGLLIRGAQSTISASRDAASPGALPTFPATFPGPATLQAVRQQHTVVLTSAWGSWPGSRETGTRFEVVLRQRAPVRVGASGGWGGP